MELALEGEEVGHPALELKQVDLAFDVELLHPVNRADARSVDPVPPQMRLGDQPEGDSDSAGKRQENQRRHDQRDRDGKEHHQDDSENDEPQYGEPHRTEQPILALA